MNIVLVNKTASGGGAALASKRLQSALAKTGIIAAKMVVQEFTGNYPEVFTTTHSGLKRFINFIRFIWERLCFLPYEKSKETRFAYSLANTGEDISKLSIFKNADIIHLHWINQGFLSINDIKQLLKLKKPIVWTMHDMWAFTGGCHYAGSCSNFRTGCMNCPFLRNPSVHDLSSRLYNKKLKLLSGANITFIGCSKWMASEALSSKILGIARIVNIPNPIDTDFYKPGDRLLARKVFGLPEDKKIILFGAAKTTDKRKGLEYLIKAIEQLSSRNKSKYLLVTFGKTKDMPQFSIDCQSISYINDETKVISLYNAADVFVVPSLEDNLPNTIMESMACGTPVVAFNTGGIPEMISHKENGYLAVLKNATDLASGIEWIIENNNAGKLSEAARNKTLAEYSENVISAKFIELYTNLLAQK